MADDVRIEMQGNFFDHRNIKFAKALNDSLEEIAGSGSSNRERFLKIKTKQKDS